MNAIQISYRDDLWIRPDEPRESLTERLANAPGDWTLEQLLHILDLAGTAPAFASDSERFVLVAEDHSWFLLEVNLLVEESASPLDTDDDFAGLNAEEFAIPGVGAGYRLVSMEAAGQWEGAPEASSELLIPRLHYFLRPIFDEASWLHATVPVPDPLDLPTVATLVEELLSGVKAARD